MADDTNGFPTRVTRDSFGPEPVNAFPVRNPATDFDGEKHGRLMFHTLAGVGQVLELAAVLFDSTGAILSSGAERWEAWNTKRATGAPFAPPTITPLSTGRYLVQYAATYPDHKGDALPLAFRGGYVDVHGDDAGVYAWRVLPTTPFGPSVEVRVYKFTGGVWVATAATQLLVLR